MWKKPLKNAEHSDGQNITLLIRLETQKALFLELSLVAEDNEK